MADQNARKYSWGPNTWFDFPGDWPEILSIHCMRFVGQEEVCPDTGRVHLQFFCVFKNAKTFTAVCGLFPGAHMEVTQNVHAARNYCRKSRTAVEGSLHHKGMEKWIRAQPKDPLSNLEPYPWQQEVLDLIEEEPDDRTIHWYWEPTGNVGKSALTKHIVLKYKDKVLPIGGKAADMKHLISGFLDKNAELRAVLIDLTRSREKFVSYEGIEEIKNGLIVNTKYETAVKVFDPPHVVVFANWAPDMSALSADRWHVVLIE